MVTLSQLKEFDAQLTEAERAERAANHEKALAEAHKRALGPILSLEPMLRIAEEQERWEELARSAGVNDEIARLVQRVTEDPALRAAKDLAAGSAARFVEDLSSGGVTKALAEMAEKASVPAYRDDHLSLMTPISVPPNYQAQLVDEVGELRSDVARVKDEVRDLREAEQRDAHRTRRQVDLVSRRAERFPLRNTIFTAIITVLVSVPLTWWLTKLLDAGVKEAPAEVHAEE